MKNGVRALLVTAAILSLATLSIQYAFASITLNGTVPTGSAGLVIIQANKQAKSSGVLKFKFSAPSAGAHAFNFCIGPASNPCGLPPPTLS